MSNKIEYNGGLTLALSVSNLDAAVEWYQDTLGFELLYKVDEIGWCELQSSVEGVNVGLSQVEVLTPGGTTPTFGVQDIDASKAVLEAKGVRIDGDIVDYPDMVRLLTFYDPDGNSLMFFEEWK